MKNYQDSDYALNKRSEGIAYRFTDGVATVTLEVYLADNPDKTEADFLELKALSDAIYLEQDRDDYNQTRKNLSIHEFEDSIDFCGIALEDSFIDGLDKQAAAKAFRELIAGGELTQKQERRFRLHIFGGLPLRKIAEREGVALRAIQQSVDAASDKLKKYFNFF